MKRILFLFLILLSIPSFVFAEGEVIPPADTIKPVVTSNLAVGKYSTRQQVILTSNEVATIYYTVDGSAPNTESDVYINPIMIDKTMTIKYFGVDIAGNESSIVSLVYTISDRDQDGIPDGEDSYPDDSTNTPPAPLPDRDEDGIPDGEDIYPDDSTNTPVVNPAYGETPEAEDNKMQNSILIMIAGIVLISLVMGVRIL